MGDTKEQEGMWTQFSLTARAATPKTHGIFVVTLASEVFYGYRGTQIVKGGKAESGNNTWTIAGGSGKFKWVKRQGACKGKGNPDGSST